MAWKYFEEPMTKDMKTFILEKISERLENVKLDGGEKSINININIKPVDPQREDKQFEQHLLAQIILG